MIQRIHKNSSSKKELTSHSPFLCAQLGYIYTVDKFLYRGLNFFFYNLHPPTSSLITGHETEMICEIKIKGKLLP